MSTKFDIFVNPRDGSPLWIKSVDTLEEAEACLTHVALVSPGEYFIYSERQGVVVDRFSWSDLDSGPEQAKVRRVYPATPASSSVKTY
jgi:hypothetical protein